MSSSARRLAVRVDEAVWNEAVRGFSRTPLQIATLPLSGAASRSETCSHARHPARTGRNSPAARSSTCLSAMRHRQSGRSRSFSGSRASPTARSCGCSSHSVIGTRSPGCAVSTSERTASSTADSLHAVEPRRSVGRGASDGKPRWPAPDRPSLQHRGCSQKRDHRHGTQATPARHDRAAVDLDRLCGSGGPARAGRRGLGRAVGAQRLERPRLTVRAARPERGPGAGARVAGRISSKVARSSWRSPWTRGMNRPYVLASDRPDRPRRT